MAASRRRQRVALLAARAQVGAALARESMDKEEEREVQCGGFGDRAVVQADPVARAARAAAAS